MTPAEQLARAVLESHASAYHVADTPHQRERVVAMAAKAAEPIINQAIRQEAERLAANPT